MRSPALASDDPLLDEKNAEGFLASAAGLGGAAFEFLRCRVEVGGKLVKRSGRPQPLQAITLGAAHTAHGMAAREAGDCSNGLGIHVRHHNPRSGY